MKMSQTNTIRKAQAVKLCNEGLNIKEISDATCTNISTVRSWLRSEGLRPKSMRGIPSTKKRAHLLDDVADLMGRGYPVLRIATTLGVSRDIINSCLKDLGIERPSVSEGNRLANKFLSEDFKRERVKSANKAVRKLGRSDITQRAASEVRFKDKFYIGKFERELGEVLCNHGLKPISQAPIEGYNIDLLVGKVAVEVHNYTSRPISTLQQVRRSVKLMSIGYSVVYLWMGGGDTISGPAIDKLVFVIKELSANPPTLGKYLVIRSDGETDFTSNRHLDDLADVMRLYCSMQSANLD